MAHKKLADIGREMATLWGKSRPPTNDEINNWTTEEWNKSLLCAAVAELIKLNQLLSCYNFVRIPTILDAIKDNTKPTTKPTKPARRKRRT